MNDTTPTTHTQDGSTAVADRPETGLAAPAGSRRPRLRDRVRSAPTGAKVAVGSAGLVVALLVGGVGGFAIGRTTADTGGDQPTGFPGGQGQMGQQGPGQLPGGQFPQGQDAPDGQGLPDGTDVPGGTTGQGAQTGTQTSWYVVPTTRDEEERAA